MTTSYPAALDSFTNPTGTDELDDEIGTRTHSEFHADTNDAIEAIQAELGTDPSGSEATVKARIAAAETATANHLADTADAHAASAITNTPAGNLSGTTVQAALNELDTEKSATGHDHSATYQPLDTDLSAIAALTSAADKVPYSTGAGTWALADLSAAARTVLDDATVGAMLTTMGGATAASPTFTGVATFAAGTAAAPAITFTGDTNTGLYSDTADTIQFSTGGTLRMSIGATGIIGQVYTSDAVTGSNVAGISNAATYVTAVGFQAAASAPVGATFLTAMGYQAGAAMVTPGTHNVTIGLQAGYQATNVSDSVLIGGLAGYQANLASASTMVGVGKSAGRGATGTYGTFVGLQAGYLSSGNYGFGLGYRALESNTAYEVVAIGHQAGLSNTYYRCVLLGTNAVASGNNQMVIGSSSSPVTSWIPGHDTDTYWDIATANTVKHYAGGQKALEVNATGGAPYLGFFGTAAVAKPTGVAVSAAGIHAALVTLGLIAA